MRGDGLQEVVHEYDVDHGALVDDEGVPLEGPVLVASVSLRRVELQQAVYGLGGHAGRLAHPLGRASRRSRQEDLQALRLERRYDALRRGGLAGTRSARQHEHLGHGRSLDGLDLDVVVSDAGGLLHGGHVELSVEEVARLRGEERQQFPGRSRLRVVERRQVYRALFLNEVLVLHHLLEGFGDGFPVGLEQRLGRFDELVGQREDVALAGQLVERVPQPAPAAARVARPVAHVLGYAVRRLEAYAPDVVGQAVGVLLHDGHALLAVLAVYLGRERGADAVVTEEEHDVLDVLLLLPALAYRLHKGLETIPCVYEDAVHFRDGLACVCSDGKWGMIDVEGNVVSDFNSDSPTFYTNGIIIKFVDGKFGAVDKEGNIVIEFQYDELSLPDENKIHYVKYVKFYIFNIILII